MQHIQLENCSIPYGSIGCAKLVSQLQQLTQLTHLTLKGTLQITSSSAPTAACAALTASSKLQHLDIRECTLPADVWEQVSVEHWRPSVLNSVCNDSSSDLLSHLRDISGCRA
jgi:hypothetical protein